MDPNIVKTLFGLAVGCGVVAPSVQTDIKVAESRNLHDYDGEQWDFKTGSVQLSAVNCCKCGNYKCISGGFRLTDKIRCECVEFEDEMYAQLVDIEEEGYNQKLVKSMMRYEGFEAFINVANPVGEKDKLCEDVVGFIFEFL